MRGRSRRDGRRRLRRSRWSRRPRRPATRGRRWPALRVVACYGRLGEGEFQVADDDGAGAVLAPGTGGGGVGFFFVRDGEDDEVGAVGTGRVEVIVVLHIAGVGAA